MGVTITSSWRPLHVLLVEVPGNALARMESEAAAVSAGHSLAVHPAASDVLLVCGTPGPELQRLIDGVWEQMPYPKHRAELTNIDDIGTILAVAGDALAAGPAQRTAAREEAANRAAGRDTEHHESEDEHSNRGDPGTAHDHDHDMAMDSDEHMAMGGPGGYPLAGGADDRDGLEMDVLHRRLGPILASWPAGLVMDVTLAGDTITAAAASTLDDAEFEHEEQRNLAVFALDQAAQVLAVAGWEAAVASTLRVRDLALAGFRDRALERLQPLRRRIERSVMLRWSVRGLQVRPGVDVRSVLLARLERAEAALSGQRVQSEPVTMVDKIPALVVGRDVGSARLIVASLTVHPGRRTNTTFPAPSAWQHHG